MNDRRTRIVLFLLIFLFTCPYALANIGLPMISVYLPPAWLALIPIILIEADVGIKTLGLSRKRSLTAMTAANLFSTVLGIPIAWLCLAFIQLIFFDGARGLDTWSRRVYAVTLQAPWLVPYEDDFRWMIPAAVVILSVPFYLTSVGTEYLIVKRFFADIEARRVWHWMLRAHLFSYGLLISLILATVLLNSNVEWIYRIMRPFIESLIEVAFLLAKLFS